VPATEGPPPIEDEVQREPEDEVTWTPTSELPDGPPDRPDHLIFAARPTASGNAPSTDPVEPPDWAQVPDIIAPDKIPDTPRSISEIQARVAEMMQTAQYKGQFIAVPISPEEAELMGVSRNTSLTLWETNLTKGGFTQFVVGAPYGVQLRDLLDGVALPKANAFYPKTISGLLLFDRPTEADLPADQNDPNYSHYQRNIQNWSTFANKWDALKYDPTQHADYLDLRFPTEEAVESFAVEHGLVDPDDPTRAFEGRLYDSENQSWRLFWIKPDPNAPPGVRPLAVDALTGKIFVTDEDTGGWGSFRDPNTPISNEPSPEFTGGPPTNPLETRYAQEHGIDALTPFQQEEANLGPERQADIYAQSQGLIAGRGGDPKYWLATPEEAVAKKPGVIAAREKNGFIEGNPNGMYFVAVAGTNTPFQPMSPDADTGPQTAFENVKGGLRSLGILDQSGQLGPNYQPTKQQFPDFPDLPSAPEPGELPAMPSQTYTLGGDIDPAPPADAPPAPPTQPLPDGDEDPFDPR